MGRRLAKILTTVFSLQVFAGCPNLQTAGNIIADALGVVTHWSRHPYYEYIGFHPVAIWGRCNLVLDWGLVMVLVIVKIAGWTAEGGKRNRIQAHSLIYLQHLMICDVHYIIENFRSLYCLLYCNFTLPRSILCTYLLILGMYILEYVHNSWLASHPC